jgi:hypothetical protein
LLHQFAKEASDVMAPVFPAPEQVGPALRNEPKSRKLDKYGTVFERLFAKEETVREEAFLFSPATAGH